jgi:hypothetical protein
MPSKLNPNAAIFIPKTHTYWESTEIEDTPSDHRELPVEIQQRQCDALNHLKHNEIFKRQLTTFLETECCVSSGINPEEGCRIDLDIRGVFYNGFVLKGKKKNQIGFWFNYKQDNFTYAIVYECDNDDPSTGCFFKNECDDECGGTCSLYECALFYQRDV